jgi:uncharacterized membrane protein
MRNKLGLLILFLILIQIKPASAQTTPTDLTINLYSDGVTRLDYLFPAEITSLQTNISLIGQSYQSLIILNEEGLPLEYVQNSDGLTVYSLGSSLVNLTYLTSELTGKNGVIWSLNITIPISSRIILPNGATIINLNIIPLEIDSINGQTSVIMPSGLVLIEYTVNIIGSDIIAEAAITEAESAIQAAESNNIVVTSAKNLLNEAKAFFQEDLFLEAEEKASQIIPLIEVITENKNLAEATIIAAESAIEAAIETGRTNGIAEAESMLNDARLKYQAGQYEEASYISEQALQAAINSEKEQNNILSYVVILSAALILVGIFFQSRRKSSDREPKPAREIEFNLELLFKEHPELRLDDREVLKFLSENDGEAFAYDIRERFDIPRTSAWRMIQRLQRYEVVDEKKIGGQSLISIKEKYRRKPE